MCVWVVCVWREGCECVCVYQCVGCVQRGLCVCVGGVCVEGGL